jgi:hypothetical protein
MAATRKRIDPRLRQLVDEPDDVVFVEDMQDDSSEEDMCVTCLEPRRLHDDGTGATKAGCRKFKDR